MDSNWLVGWGVISPLIVIGVQAMITGKVKSKFDESLESVKSGFTKDVEKLKSDLALNVNSEVAKLQASLSKQNISHQIHSAEYMKYKFDKVVKMYVAVINASKMRFDFQEKIKKMPNSEALKELDNVRRANWEVRDQLTETFLFLNSQLEENISNFLNSEIMAFERIIELNEAQNEYESFLQGTWKYDEATGFMNLSEDLKELEFEDAKEKALVASFQAKSRYDNTFQPYLDALIELKDGFKAELSGIDIKG